MEITAFESKAHAKKDYFHVGKRGEMAAASARARPAPQRRAGAGGLWVEGREGGSHPNNLKRQRQAGRNTTAVLLALRWSCQSGYLTEEVSFVTKSRDDRNITIKTGYHINQHYWKIYLL